MVREIEITRFSPGRISGASPASAEDYTLIMFDISNQKKYRMLVRILKKYGARVQKSVFEAYLTRMQLKELEKSLNRLMTRDDYHDENDAIRIYRIAGNCDAVVYGRCASAIMEENVIL